MELRDVVVGAGMGWMISFVLTTVTISIFKLSGFPAALTGAALGAAGVLLGALFGARQI